MRGNGFDINCKNRSLGEQIKQAVKIHGLEMSIDHSKPDQPVLAISTIPSRIVSRAMVWLQRPRV